jgi:hypothetical protein
LFVCWFVCLKETTNSNKQTNKQPNNLNKQTNKQQTKGVPLVFDSEVACCLAAVVCEALDQPSIVCSFVCLFVTNQQTNKQTNTQTNEGRVNCSGFPSHTHAWCQQCSNRCYSNVCLLVCLLACLFHCVFVCLLVCLFVC